jgi:hypothetical protein
MNKTWQLKDDPANYDDEGSYDEGMPTENQIQGYVARMVAKLCKEAAEGIKEENNENTGMA